MSAFHAALTHTLEIEGGYVDDPDDVGGETNWGITEATARRFGYTGPMSELPKEEAERIYFDGYWQPYDLSEIADIEPAVAIYIFDMAVNHAPPTWVSVVQRAVRHREGIALDGRWGPNTLAAVKNVARREPKNLLGAMKVYRGQHYIDRAENVPGQRKFLWGWLKRCA